ncbi:MAG: Wzz/FepE/Etk N-terminal domain-containing protein [Gammaproteobacteria bacterium]|nr:Wzz/FepE/Etk N-terminal domain-containing protein [Gammaproteobacteria bacterium]
MDNMMNNEEKQNSSKGTQQAVPPYAYYPQTISVEEDKINLVDYWWILMERKKLIVLITLLFTITSIVVALLMTPIYRAEVLLAPMGGEGSGGAASALGQFGGLASMVGIDLGSNSTEHTLAVLTSRRFLEVFLKEEKILPILFSDIWDDSSGQWILEEGKEPPSMWSAYKVFSKSILMNSINKDSGLVTISIDWKDPELAAEWANNLIVRLNKKLRTLAVTEAESSINYLQEQLQQTSVVDMHQVLYRLIESETQKIMLAKVSEQYALKVIDPAVMPEEKIKPKRAVIVILGFLSGFMFSVFLAFLLTFIVKQRKAAQ